jgi:tripartite motif-containing protein 71
MPSHFLNRRSALTLFVLMINLAACSGVAQTPPPTVTSAPTVAPLPSATATVKLEPTITPTPRPLGQPLTLIWQTEYTPKAALQSPSDIAVDAEGNVYVSTQGNLNIKKFNNQGKLVTQWGTYGTGEGQFNLTSGLALDAQGNVYINDFFNGRVQKFDSNGKFLLQWPTEAPVGPASIAVDAQGNVYVDNFFPHKHQITKFDPTGKIITAWASTGAGDGQIGIDGNAGPEDLALDKDGNLYVADRVNHRIQKFDPNGKFLAKFGGEVSTEGHGLFLDPLGLALDAKGNIYAVDTYFLQKLDPQGNFIEQWSTTHKGDLNQAQILAFDSEGNLYTFVHVKHGNEDIILVSKFAKP